MKDVAWWKKYKQARYRRDYGSRLYGTRHPESLLRRPTKREMYAAAKRFARDGEMHNAVEMIRCAHYPEQLNLTLRMPRWR